MMFGKKGVAPLVATAILILVTVVAVGFIWIGFKPLVKSFKSSQQVNFGDEDFVEVLTSGGYTVYDPNKKVISVRIKQGPYENIKKLNVNLLFSDGNSFSDFVDPPGPNNAKVYYFDLKNFHQEPKYVRVIPILKDGRTGIPSVKVAIPKVKIADLPSNIPSFGICDENDVKECGSSDVGACKKGIQKCVDGKWGPCEGAVDPSPEDCFNGIDDDCDGKTDSADLDCENAVEPVPTP